MEAQVKKLKIRCRCKRPFVATVSMAVVNIETFHPCPVCHTQYVHKAGKVWRAGEMSDSPLKKAGEKPKEEVVEPQVIDFKPVNKGTFPAPSNLKVVN
jgi:hypothetical protein